MRVNCPRCMKPKERRVLELCVLTVEQNIPSVQRPSVCIEFGAMGEAKVLSITTSRAPFSWVISESSLMSASWRVGLQGVSSYSILVFG